MANNKFYLLNYDHLKIEALLKKIDEGWVLNEADYDQLINLIGLDNISTFSGWYDDLKGKPDLINMIENAVNNVNGATIESIRNFILEQDAAIANELDLLNKEVYNNRATRQDLKNGLAQKSDILHNHDLNYAKKELEHDHDNKTVIDSITENNILNWTETGLNLAAFKVEAYDTFAQLLDVINMLERKANVVHFHDSQYASKESEHIHTNLGALDNVTDIKLTEWNSNTDKVKTLEDYINLLTGEIDEVTERLNNMSVSGVTKAELTAELLNYAKLTEVKNQLDNALANYYDKTNMEQLLANKVDIEEGKGLSTNDLTDELHALLLEILNDADNTEKTVNEFVLDRIDKALVDPDSELAKALANKVEKELIDPNDESKGYKVLSDNNFTDEQLALLEEILNGNDVDGNGSVSVSDYVNDVINNEVANVDEVGSIGNILANKVDKEFKADGVTEKVLSENDFTDAHKALLDEVLGIATSLGMTDFVNRVIENSIANVNPDDLAISIGDALEEKVDKKQFVTLEKNQAGNIEVVADDIAEDVFDESKMIKLSDAQLINPDFVVGDKLAEVQKDMGLTEVPFTEEQNNFLNKVMEEGATNDDKVKSIITESINAVGEDGAPVPGSINEALTNLDELIENKVDKEEGATLAENQDGTEGLIVVASGAVTDPNTQIAIDDPRLEGSGANEGDYINIIQKGLSSNDYTDADKLKLDSIALITEAEIDTAFEAAGFDI